MDLYTDEVREYHQLGTKSSAYSSHGIVCSFHSLRSVNVSAVGLLDKCSATELCVQFLIS